MSWLNSLNPGSVTKRFIANHSNLARNPFDKDALVNWQGSMHTGLVKQRGEFTAKGDKVYRKEKNKSSNDPSKVGSASWNMGELMRKEWDDYVTRFQPYDKKLISIATGQADNEAMVANARAGVNNSFAVSNGTTLRNLSRLGISQSSDEMQSNNRINDTNKTLADISASNNARMAAEDRDMKIMSGNAAVGLRDSRLQEA
jgi:hypothetical protein